MIVNAIRNADGTPLAPCGATVAYRITDGTHGIEGAEFVVDGGSLLVVVEQPRSSCDIEQAMTDATGAQIRDGQDRFRVDVA